MDNSNDDVRKNGRLLRATLYLQLQNYLRDSDERPELLLARAGLEYQDIAELLGKKPDAVRMFLKRNKTT